MDGTSDTIFMQKSKELEKFNPEENIFCSSTVSLRLKNLDTGEIIWENPIPNSTKCCTPIRLRFVKETNDVIKEEEMDLKTQIENLPSIFVGTTKIKFKFYFTMIDGKVCILFLNYRFCIQTIIIIQK